MAGSRSASQSGARNVSVRENPQPASIELSDVGATSLTTLYCRALESSSDSPVLSDPFAVALTRQLDPILRSSNAPLHRQLVERKVDSQLAVYVAMRARRFDAYAREFTERHPEGVIVNLGCGFDTRFHRIDDGKLRLFDLDRSEVIQKKRQLLSESDRYRFIEASVLDKGWMTELPSPGIPALFLAEGLFMYLPLAGVKSLVLGLQEKFPGSELVAEVFSTRWLSPWLKWSIDWKLRRKFCFGKEARFLSGLRESSDMERWGAGIEFIDQWCALDEREPKIGIPRALRHFEFFRKVNWVVHYRLHQV